MTPPSRSRGAGPRFTFDECRFWRNGQRRHHECSHTAVILGIPIGTCCCPCHDTGVQRMKRKFTNVQLFIAAWRTQSGDCTAQVLDFVGVR